MSASPINQEMITCGLCTDMCPDEEKTRRAHENDIHKIEQKFGVMIKKLQRSSADHDLQIPRFVRTPGSLLNTAKYIEENIMDIGLNPTAGEEISRLEAYLFIWDRFRMIAKDFILQMASDELSDTTDPFSSYFMVLSPSIVDDMLLNDSVACARMIWERKLNDLCCVYTHECMTRWFIMMDHYMCQEEEFVTQHRQQNGEQLFRLIKSLIEFYDRCRKIELRKSVSGDPMNDLSSRSSSENEINDADRLANEAEFACYFILYQLDNGKEVPVYIRGLSSDIQKSPDVQFAIKVWKARKTSNYSEFFYLLKHKATYLQACIMFKYVTSVRMVGLRRLTRIYRQGKSESYLPVSNIQQLLMFEDQEDTVSFLNYCGVECDSGFDPDLSDSGLCAILNGQNIDSLLPEDKNGNAILPVTRVMLNGIESKRIILKEDDEEQCTNSQIVSKAEVCRGACCSAARFTPQRIYKWVMRNALLNSKLTAKAAPRKVIPTPVKAVEVVASAIVKAPAVPSPPFSLQTSPAPAVIPSIEEAVDTTSKAIKIPPPKHVTHEILPTSTHASVAPSVPLISQQFKPKATDSKAEFIPNERFKGAPFEFKPFTDPVIVKPEMVEKLPNNISQFPNSQFEPKMPVDAPVNAFTKKIHCFNPVEPQKQQTIPTINATEDLKLPVVTFGEPVQPNIRPEPQVNPPVSVLLQSTTNNIDVKPIEPIIVKEVISPLMKISNLYPTEITVHHHRLLHLRKNEVIRRRALKTALMVMSIWKEFFKKLVKKRIVLSKKFFFSLWRKIFGKSRSIKQLSLEKIVASINEKNLPTLLPGSNAFARKKRLRELEEFSREKILLDNQGKIARLIGPSRWSLENHCSMKVSDIVQLFDLIPFSAMKKANVWSSSQLNSFDFETFQRSLPSLSRLFGPYLSRIQSAFMQSCSLYQHLNLDHSEHVMDWNSANGFVPKWNGACYYKFGVCSSAGLSNHWERRSIVSDLLYVTPNIIRLLLSKPVETLELDSNLCFVDEFVPVDVDCDIDEYCKRYWKRETERIALKQGRTVVSCVDICKNTRLNSANSILLLVSEMDLLLDDNEFRDKVCQQLQSIGTTPVVLLFSRDKLVKAELEDAKISWYVLDKDSLHNNSRKFKTVKENEFSCNVSEMGDDDISQILKFLAKVYAVCDVQLQISCTYILNSVISDMSTFPYFSVDGFFKYFQCLSDCLLHTFKRQEAEFQAYNNALLSNILLPASFNTSELFVPTLSSVIPLVTQLNTLDYVYSRVFNDLWESSVEIHCNYSNIMKEFYVIIERSVNACKETYKNSMLMQNLSGETYTKFPSAEFCVNGTCLNTVLDVNMMASGDLPASWHTLTGYKNVLACLDILKITLAEMFLNPNSIPILFQHLSVDERNVANHWRYRWLIALENYESSVSLNSINEREKCVSVLKRIIVILVRFLILAVLASQQIAGAPCANMYCIIPMKFLSEKDLASLISKSIAKPPVLSICDDDNVEIHEGESGGEVMDVCSAVDDAIEEVQRSLKDELARSQAFNKYLASQIYM